jgi:hypothetical protein
MAQSTDNGVSLGPAARSAGARGHTSSGGHRRPGVPYDAGAQAIDDPFWNHPEMVVRADRGPGGSP